MFGSEYITNDSALWSTLWVMELRIVDLTKEIHRSSLLEFAGQVAVPCVAEALMGVLEPAHTGDRLVDDVSGKEPGMVTIEHGDLPQLTYSQVRASARPGERWQEARDRNESTGEGA